MGSRRSPILWPASLLPPGGSRGCVSCVKTILSPLYLAIHACRETLLLYQAASAFPLATSILLCHVSHHNKPLSYFPPADSPKSVLILLPVFFFLLSILGRLLQIYILHSSYKPFPLYRLMKRDDTMVSSGTSQPIAQRTRGETE